MMRKSISISHGQEPFSDMKRIFTSLVFLCTAYANSCDYSFYIKAGSGISFSQPINVIAPATTWNEAVQGYNAKLGNQAIAGFAIGCELMSLANLELGVSNRTSFKYRKFQTPVDGGESYTREFDLDVTPIIFSVNLLGREIPCLNWGIGCGKIYPILGAGVGVSYLLITNYRTTGLLPTGGSSPHQSFSAENEYTLRKKFTYSALIGLEYDYNACWALATGYRWLDAGRFKGPRYLRVDTGSAVDIANDSWRMRFRSNEWFVELKIFI
jgi:hypothetical protein